MRLFHWCVCLLLCLLTVLAVSLVAQTFPMTVKTYWVPPVVDATHSAPDGYTLTIDGGPPIAIGTPTVNDVNCPVATYPAGCVLATPTITAAGQHQFCAVAFNQWGTSAPACATANINTPGTIVWVRIVK